MLFFRALGPSGGKAILPQRRGEFLAIQLVKRWQAGNGARGVWRMRRGRREGVLKNLNWISAVITLTLRYSNSLWTKWKRKKNFRITNHEQEFRGSASLWVKWYPAYYPQWGEGGRYNIPVIQVSDPSVFVWILQSEKFPRKAEVGDCQAF